MDFFILLGFKFFFDLLWPEKKAASRAEEPSTEAAFWYGTSFENIGKEQNIPENKSISEPHYEHYEYANYEDSEYYNT
jgi:hypothetical protein